MTYDELTTHSRIAAASREAATNSHAVPSQERANAFVQELCDLLHTETIPVSVISPDQAASLGHGVADPVDGIAPSEAFVVEGRREIFIVDAGQQPLIRGLLLFHEVTHVLCPTDPAHGPAFVRAWLDLCRRSGLYALLADTFLEPALRAEGVAIAADPSPLAQP